MMNPNSFTSDVCTYIILNILNAFSTKSGCHKTIKNEYIKITHKTSFFFIPLDFILNKFLNFAYTSFTRKVYWFRKFRFVI